MINAKEVLDPIELHEFVQGLIDQHGDTPEQLMVLLLKIATAKAILEDALQLDEPITAVLQKEDE
jgi:hypothetical protein